MRGCRSFAVVAMIVATGCKDQQPGPVLVRGMNINDYEFDYEGFPQTIQADAGDVHISTGKTQIEVVDRTLRVDGRSYGWIKPKDRVSVDGDKVSVNGEVRKQIDGPLTHTDH
jgi:hypothetical protein